MRSHCVEHQQAHKAKAVQDDDDMQLLVASSGNNTSSPTSRKHRSLVNLMELSLGVDDDDDDDDSSDSSSDSDASSSSSSGSSSDEEEQQQREKSVVVNHRRQSNVPLEKGCSSPNSVTATTTRAIIAGKATSTTSSQQKKRRENRRKTTQRTRSSESKQSRMSPRGPTVNTKDLPLQRSHSTSRITASSSNDQETTMSVQDRRSNFAVAKERRWSYSNLLSAIEKGGVATSQVPPSASRNKDKSTRSRSTSCRSITKRTVAGSAEEEQKRRRRRSQTRLQASIKSGQHSNHNNQCRANSPTPRTTDHISNHSRTPMHTQRRRKSTGGITQLLETSTNTRCHNNGKTAEPKKTTQRKKSFDSNHTGATNASDPTLVRPTSSRRGKKKPTSSPLQTQKSIAVSGINGNQATSESREPLLRTQTSFDSAVANVAKEESNRGRLRRRKSSSNILAAADPNDAQQKLKHKHKQQQSPPQKLTRSRSLKRLEEMKAIQLKPLSTSMARDGSSASGSISSLTASTMRTDDFSVNSSHMDLLKRCYSCTRLFDNTSPSNNKNNMKNDDKEEDNSNTPTGSSSSRWTSVATNKRFDASDGIPVAPDHDVSSVGTTRSTLDALLLEAPPGGRWNSINSSLDSSRNNDSGPPRMRNSTRGVLSDTSPVIPQHDTASVCPSVVSSTVGNLPTNVPATPASTGSRSVSSGLVSELTPLTSVSGQSEGHSTITTHCTMIKEEENKTSSERLEGWLNALGPLMLHQENSKSKTNAAAATTNRTLTSRRHSLGSLKGLAYSMLGSEHKGLLQGTEAADRSSTHVEQQQNPRRNKSDAGLVASMAAAASSLIADKDNAPRMPARRGSNDYHPAAMQMLDGSSARSHSLLDESDTSYSFSETNFSHSTLSHERAVEAL